MRDLELTVGDVYDLELRGLGSAGYSWHTEVIGPEGVLEIHRTSSGQAPSAEPGGEPPPSGSLPEVLRLGAVGEGRVTLRLALRRRWEQDEPLETDELDVVVRR